VASIPFLGTYYNLYSVVIVIAGPLIRSTAIANLLTTDN
jgi:hypothetical protein